MIRETSIEAYNQIKSNGLLSLRRWEVYDILFRKGPLTANEAFREIAMERGKRAQSLLSVSNARFTELRKIGVVKEVCERTCTLSGVKVIEWDVTDRLPVKLDKPEKHKCRTCNGKGYIQTQQARFDV